MIGRRSFLTGLAALITAPAIVRPSSLMAIKPIDSIFARYKGIELPGSAYYYAPYVPLIMTSVVDSDFSRIDCPSFVEQMRLGSFMQTNDPNWVHTPDQIAARDRAMAFDAERHFRTRIYGNRA